ncbi:V-type ATP synthase subunit C [Candidatus Bilamarchaeum dharawalense]|uniref:V-type ATP synthase subunit C n=1 Tax=Candidatus Bilamarchaeum dharawalense TaxID=2885759 RepID=A0A5E4LTJ6_9ARCH|nr:V-type ATP synthase subunit C [Candidatus Bilamarchaeum dharawalense]
MNLQMPKLESRALKYGYSNARVKAMKGLLLKSNQLEEMIRVNSVEAMVELLYKTGYKNELAGAAVNYSGSALVELAASRNFAKIVRKLIKITPKEDQAVVRALLIRWDLLNLKSLMHAKRLKRSYDEVRPYLFEVGGLREEDFKRIMKADEASIMRELRRTELGEKMLAIGTANLSRRMRESFTSALRSLDMFLQMETIIDAYIYMFMDHALSEVGAKEVGDIRQLLRREIDAKNILIIERLKRHGINKEKIFGSLIKGGTLNELTLNRVIEAKDLQAVIHIIRPKFRQIELKGEAGKLKLTDLEIALEKSITAQKVLAFHTTVLSVGVIVGFLLLKEEEINNIRKIAKCKEFNVPENEVREMLVVV